MSDQAAIELERRIATLSAKLLTQLRRGGRYLHCDLVTDAAGLAFLVDASEDTVRKWRGRAPPYGPEWLELVPGRVVYEIDTIAQWMLDQRSNRKIVGV